MKKTILAVALSLSLTAGSVQAGTISFNFSGHWTSVADGLKSWFTKGGYFTLGVSYVPGVDATTSAASISVRLITDDWLVNLANPKVQIKNDFVVSGGSGKTDQFAISLPAGSLVLLPLASGFTQPTATPSFSLGMFNLTDSTAQVFSDSTLPAEIVSTSLPLESMSQRFFLFFEDGQNVAGQIDSITHPTPEPATLLLFATGLTALAAYRRRLSNET